MIRLRSLRVATAALVLAIAPASSDAQQLLVSTGLGSYAENQYGGSRWTTMTSFINSAFSGGSVTTTSTVDNSAYVLGFDRLWLDQRLGPPLSGIEINTLQAFAATGRRMVLVGENDNWASWNQQLTSIVGGAIAGPNCSFGNFAASVNHPLTAGVGAVEEVCGQSMFGGTSLFAGRGFATLFGPNQNVLVWLDSNMQEDAYLSRADNRQFAANVATWLAGGHVAVVPEPSTYALVAAGLVAMVVVSRRRRPMR